MQCAYVFLLLQGCFCRGGIVLSPSSHCSLFSYCGGFSGGPKNKRFTTSVDLLTYIISTSITSLITGENIYHSSRPPSNSKGTSHRIIRSSLFLQSFAIFFTLGYDISVRTDTRDTDRIPVT